MDNIFKRRRFMKSFASLPLLTSISAELKSPGFLQASNTNTGQSKLRISLNAFSFNAPLMAKKMTLDDLLDICADIGFDGVDITAYYFPDYPNVPNDKYIYQVKRKAFRLGLDITGTGVRNDFTEPDKSKRAAHVMLVKNWIDAAAKLGAPVIRVFAGSQRPAGFTRSEILEWMLHDIRECLEYGKERGVVVAIQNHDDFIQTADHANEFVNLINSEWFGLILDTGSYRLHDPYDEIAKSAMHAVNWQIKENVFVNGAETPADIPKLIKIIKDSGYRGYIPIETLGPGDAKVKVVQLFDQIRKAIA
jgi:sugar phosphate isomerase/epimerase